MRRINNFASKLFLFAQLLVAFVSQLCKLCGVSEEFLDHSCVLCCRGHLIICSNFVFHFSQWGISLLNTA